MQPVYQLMLAEEQGQWVQLEELARRFPLSEGEVAQAYLQAVEWARQVKAEQML